MSKTREQAALARYTTTAVLVHACPYLPGLALLTPFPSGSHRAWRDSVTGEHVWPFKVAYRPEAFLRYGVAGQAGPADTVGLLPSSPAAAPVKRESM